jgi:hypothetical protein
MTTKTPGKTPHEQERAAMPSQQDMQMAYRAHTLAQMLYGQLAMTHPWIGPAYPPSPYDFLSGPQMSPWAAQWPPMWGAGPMDPWAGPFPQTFGFHGFPHR